MRVLVRRKDERSAQLEPLGADVVVGDLLDLESVRAAVQGVRRIGAVHVRPTLFAENLIIMGAETVASVGKLYLPYAAEKHAPVAAADIARVVSGVLAHPAGHVGERYVVTRPRNLSLDEMAGVMSQELAGDRHRSTPRPVTWRSETAWLPSAISILSKIPGGWLRGCGRRRRRGKRPSVF